MTRGAPIPDTVTLHVPFRIVKRGGRKEMQRPEGATQLRRADSTLVKGSGTRIPLENGCWSQASSRPSPNWPERAVHRTPHT